MSSQVQTIPNNVWQVFALLTIESWGRFKIRRKKRKEKKETFIAI